HRRDLIILVNKLRGDPELKGAKDSAAEPATAWNDAEEPYKDAGRANHPADSGRHFWATWTAEQQRNRTRATTTATTGASKKSAEEGACQVGREGGHEGSARRWAKKGHHFGATVNSRLALGGALARRGRLSAPKMASADIDPAFGEQASASKPDKSAIFPQAPRLGDPFTETPTYQVQPPAGLNEVEELRAALQEAQNQLRRQERRQRTHSYQNPMQGLLSNDSLKLVFAEINKFNGRGLTIATDLRLFVTKMERFFKLSCTGVTTQADIAATKLDGTPATLWFNHLKTFQDEDDAT
ncbi:MAG: hypothetical protein BJ554DRAFT_3084, partial [Olpidium bornovanus]